MAVSPRKFMYYPELHWLIVSKTFKSPPSDGHLIYCSILHSYELTPVSIESKTSDGYLIDVMWWQPDSETVWPNITRGEMCSEYYETRNKECCKLFTWCNNILGLVWFGNNRNWSVDITCCLFNQGKILQKSRRERQNLVGVKSPLTKPKLITWSWIWVLFERLRIWGPPMQLSFQNWSKQSSAPWVDEFWSEYK